MHFSSGIAAFLIATTDVHDTFLNLVLWGISNCIGWKFGVPRPSLDAKFSAKNSAGE